MTQVITGDELAEVLARRHPDMPAEAAGRLARTLLADAEAHRESASKPLSNAECDRLREMVDEHTEAVSAVRAGLEMAAPLDDGDRATVAAAWEALKVLSGEETGGACACGQEECRG